MLARIAPLPGLEALQAVARGDLPPPPIAKTLGFGPIEVEKGRATFTVEPAEFHYNPIGVVHGGLASRCSTRRWDVPSTRRSTPAWRTRRSR